MNRLWIRVCTALLIAMGMVFMMLTPKAEPAFSVQASAMALIECESGKLIAGQNKDLRLPMASTTKIMTALIVLERSELSDIVEIPDEAVGTEGSSIYLRKGERLSVEDLLYGLMLASGNDAAVALAVHAAGSVDGFVELMNDKAGEMGLKNTSFITPNGLHAERHLTTAYELCLIAREALKLDEFRTIVSSKYHRTATGDIDRTFKNKNSLLWSYEGAFGVKTGYTMAAGRCLVFGAERDGMTVVGAVLNCRQMFEEAASLMDMAFEEYSRETIVPACTHVLDTYIKNGEEKLLEVYSKESIITVMRKSERKSFRTEAVLSEGLHAPIAKGDEVGILRVFDGGALIGSTALIAGNSVSEPGYVYWWRLLTDLFAA